MPEKLVIASHNRDKVREISEFLAPYGFEVAPAASLGVDEPEETGSTFTENATLKAENSSRKSKLVALADDSGLAVDALDGAPGIYSARWGGEKKDFAFAMNRVRDEIIGKGKNPEGALAKFICVLALSFPNGRTEIFEGEVQGTLTFPPRGLGGFGYDPIFVPTGYDKTFGELDWKIKNEISHRANAFQKFKQFCDSNFTKN